LSPSKLLDIHEGCTTGTVPRKSFRNLHLFAPTHHTRLGTCPPPLRRLTIAAALARGSSALLPLLFDLQTVGTVAASWESFLWPGVCSPWRDRWIGVAASNWCSWPRREWC